MQCLVRGLSQSELVDGADLFSASDQLVFLETRMGALHSPGPLGALDGQEKPWVR